MKKKTAFDDWRLSEIDGHGLIENCQPKYVSCECRFLTIGMILLHGAGGLVPQSLEVGHNEGTAGTKIQLFVGDQSGLPVRGTGLVCTQAADLDEGPALEPETGAKWMRMDLGVQPIWLELEPGVQDCWISVPGYAHYVTTVLTPGSSRLVVTLEPTASIAVEWKDNTERADPIQGTIAFSEPPGFEHSHTRAFSPWTVNPKGAWTRLPSGDYTIRFVMPSTGSGGGSTSFERSMIRRISIASGENLTVALEDADFLPHRKAPVTGRLVVARAWYDQAQIATQPRLHLYNKDIPDQPGIEADCRVDETADDSSDRSFIWTANVGVPGSYVVKIDPFVYWADLRIESEQDQEVFSVAAPCDLEVKFNSRSSASILVPEQIRLVAESAKSLGLHAWEHVAATNRVSRIRVASEQDLRVDASFGLGYFPEPLTLATRDSHVVIQGFVQSTRDLILTLRGDEGMMPRSMSWWVQHLRLTDTISHLPIMFEATAGMEGSVHLRIPQSNAVQVCLVAGNQRSDVLLIPPAAGPVHLTNHEFRILRNR